MKNRKLISLICALAMVFSMFSGLVVNAEATKGIELTSSISEDDKTITIKAKAVGTEGALSSFGIAFNVPEGVELANVTATSTAGLTTNVKNGALTVAFLDMTGNGVEFANGELATIVIALDEALTAPFEFTLLEKSSIADADGEVTVKKGTMAAATTTVTPTNMPTPKPTSPARPTAVPTAEPSEPVPTNVPASGKGIDLSATIDSTNTVVTIKAKAVGTEGALSSFGIAFNVPEGVELANVTATSTAGLTTNVKNGALTVAFLDMTGNGVEFANGELATIVITLPSALTEPYAFTLLEKSSVADADGEVTVKKGMTATSVVVSPVGEATPAPVKTIALKDYVASDAADKVTEATGEGKDVYVTVDVEKKDGSSAVYGTDFTASYNGKELTEAEFTNLISGYTEDSMADIINGLSFNIYNNDVNKVSTTVNAVDGDGNAEQIVDPTDKTLTPATPTPAPKAPTITVTPTSKTVTVGTKVTIKADVKNPVDGGVLTATSAADAIDYVTGSGIVVDEATQTVTFTAAIKGKVVITYTYTDADGNDLAKAVTSTITIKEATGGNGSSSKDDTSSSTGNNGPIANGNIGTGTTGVTGLTKFNDLDSVAWAQEAITKLAAMGAINGRDANTFDPNANITRAEYCQILVNAIGKSQEAADSNFADVDTNAWYYHSVSVASNYGIVSGYGDGNFGPNDLITRRDMALMTMKAAQVMGVNLTAVRTLTFADADQFDYAAEAINTLANAGIINGMTETEFAPLANATRAQAAKIIYDTFVK